MNFKEYKNKKLGENKVLKEEYAKVKEERKLSYLIGENIKKAREHNGLTQKELALVISTKQSAISRVENGSELPSLSFLKRIADAFGIQLSRFIEEGQNTTGTAKTVAGPEGIFISSFTCINGESAENYSSETEKKSFINSKI